MSRTVCTTNPLGQFSIARLVCLGAGRRITDTVIQVGLISYDTADITVYMTLDIITDSVGLSYTV